MRENYPIVPPVTVTKFALNKDDTCAKKLHKQLNNASFSSSFISKAIDAMFENADQLSRVS